MNNRNTRTEELDVEFHESMAEFNFFIKTGISSGNIKCISHSATTVEYRYADGSKSIMCVFDPTTRYVTDVVQHVFK